MCDANTNVPSPEGPKRPSTLSNVLIVLVPVLLLVAAAGGWYWMEARKVEDNRPDAQAFKVAVDFPLTLDPQFTDADGDMVADPPKDSKDWIDPPTLVFATLGPDPAREAEIWADFTKYLHEKTGKEVEVVNTNFLRREQFADLANGKVHVLGLSTGNVPAAVNLGGFVPVCVMADKDGHFGYQMELIVPADSPVQSPQDIRGKRIAFANFQSHSGFKLPVVTLWEAGLLFDRDYKWTYTGSQTASVKWIAEKRCDAAGVASDLLAREVASGKIKKDQYRTVYTSDTYPPGCFGHVHNLKPELAAKIREAFLKFPWAGSSLEKAYKESNQVEFVQVNYAKDWAGVRATDESLRKAFQSR